MTTDLLTAIVASAERTAHERERIQGLGAPADMSPGRAPDGPAFAASLAAPGISVIAECKRRSPSRGVLRREYSAAGIAEGYARAGAAAISVLTEPAFFDGDLAHLRQVRARVATPLLRKDFVVAPFQVDEAAAAGADAVLLIVAALEPARLAKLRERAEAAGLAALIEVHDEAELTIALDAGATIVGVNCRNLRTMATTPETFDTLAPLLPSGIVAVAESGLRTAADVVRLHKLRYDAFLIGERFVSGPDPGAALAALLSDAREDTTA